MIQVARAGKIILKLENPDEFWAKVTSGEILPTDHCWTPGHVTWKLVSQMRPDDSPEFQGEAPARTVDEELELIQLRINRLVEAPPLRRPAACAHCGDDQLKTAQLVYEQGTRVGVGYDFGDKDFTIFGSKSLQSMGISPPSEPGDATRSLGARWYILFLTYMCFGTINMVIVVTFMMPYQHSDPGGAHLAAVLALEAVNLTLTVLFYRWLKSKVLPSRMRKRAEKLLEKAFAYNEWKNTWICGACGRMTVRTAKGE